MGPNDASYVDVAHTNAMIPGLGVMNNLGQADYYLNGGRTQPACQALSAVEATGIPGAGFALTTSELPVTKGLNRVFDAPSYFL